MTFANLFILIVMAFLVIIGVVAFGAWLFRNEP
jgi:hypothetical protein